MSDLDLCINTIRGICADMIESAGSGHPGAPLGCAPIAHLLYAKYMKYNMKNPHWLNRDRFVLSNGHAAALLYTMIHLSGGALDIDDLKQLRKINSRTPGHPEKGITPGVEVTTGPLGQGISNAVGLAIAEAHLSATFNRPDFEIFDNYTYCILGDGCMQEGVASEACSLAGHLKLGKLIAFYDDNKVTIDGETDLAFSEDVQARFRAYNWDVTEVSNGDSDMENLSKAIEKAKTVTDKPSLIVVKTTIGFGSVYAGTSKAHSVVFGEENLGKLKSSLGLDPTKSYQIPDQVKKIWFDVQTKNLSSEEDWEQLFKNYSKRYPKEAEEIKRRFDKKLPDNWDKDLPTYTPNDKPSATRNSSNDVLNAIASTIPELIGGSADLTPSNLTKWDGAVEFQHSDSKSGNYSGRYFRFGVREHGMLAVLNGIAAYGCIIPFGATFLNFISYGLGALRLGSLSHLHVIYITTHDSIGLGEDGPTHQPIESLAMLRAIPNLYVFRPADGNETVAAYRSTLTNNKFPTLLSLSRQKVPQLNSCSQKALKGAYVILDAHEPHVVLIATGTEVAIACDAAQILGQISGFRVRVVSMPCRELFEEQTFEYRASILPAGVPIVSCEAQSTLGWNKYAHNSVGLDSFGASGDPTDVYEKFGITAKNLATTAADTVKFYNEKGHPPPNLLDTPAAQHKN